MAAFVLAHPTTEEQTRQKSQTLREGLPANTAVKQVSAAEQRGNALAQTADGLSKLAERALTL